MGAEPLSPEVRERAVRLVQGHQGEHEAQRAAIASIASKIGCSPETLGGRGRQAKRNAAERAGLTIDEREHLKALEPENRELKRAVEEHHNSRTCERAHSCTRLTVPRAAAPCAPAPRREADEIRSCGGHT